jgi:concentrative nucleoside transporter, CNT family
MNFVWGLLGIIFVLAVAFLLSNNKKAIRLQTVLDGLILQLLFAFIVLKWEPGRKAVEAITEKIANVIEYSRNGVQFLFGNLGDAVQPTGFIFAFQVLTIIIFLSSLISVLYYLGIMQIIIRFIGGGLAKLLGTRQAESLSAAANIFLGQTEAPLLIRPYISRLTNSELFAVMVGGLASVSGSTLFGYAALGVPIEFLLAASIMSAPAGLAMAKMILPETEKDREREEVVFEKDWDVVNVVDAAARGGIRRITARVKRWGHAPCLHCHYFIAEWYVRRDRSLV